MFRRGEPEDRNEQGQRQQPIQPSEVRMRDQGNASNQEVTVVGKGARLEGSLISAGSLRIDGQVKGKITAEGDVSLSPQSEVDAEIRAASVTVAGTFKGNIVATNRTEMARGGKVDGNVTTKVLVVAEGATFTGQSIMDGRTPTQSTAATEPAATASDNGEAATEPERSRAR
jgi:cytoskeletal protein CcmA (bactofilin family)